MRKRIQFLAAFLWTWVGLAAADVSFEEKLLLKTASIIRDETFSPDGRLLAYTEKTKDGKQVAVVGDKKGEPFDAIKDIAFAPDCKTVVYDGVLGKKVYCVVGDQKGEAFDHVSRVFSKSGNAVAYTGTTYNDLKEGKDQVVFNGKPGEWFKKVDALTLNSDGTTVAYRATLPDSPTGKSSRCMVVNDKKGETFESVGDPIFSADGKSVAYTGSNFDRGSSKWHVVVDDKKSEEYREVALLSFFPSGKKVSFIAMKNGPFFVVMDDKKIDAEGIGDAHSLVISPDGKTAAFGAKSRKGWRMVVGDKRGTEFEMVGPPVFSPDSTTVAYWAEKGGKKMMVVGDKVGEEFERIGQPVFSPVGNKVAYAAMTGSNGYVIVEDRKQEGASYWESLPIYWSPDGSAVAYRVDRSSKRHIVAGDKKSEDFKEVTQPAFSPDGRKVAFGAQKESTDPKTFLTHYEYWWKAINLK